MRRCIRAARSRARRAHELRADERGSSPVEFVLVGGLLTVLTLGVLQLGLAVYVRNVVHDSAVEGAHVAALADTTASEGAARTRELITRTVGVEYAGDVSVREVRGDRPLIEVTVVTTLPLAGLIGLPHALEVTARAPRESLG